MMGQLSPMTLRICRTISMPFISGMSQSMIYTLKASPCSTAYLVRMTASLPEMVHSGRMPILESMVLTLRQVLVSSSATSARSPSSWGSCLISAFCPLRGKQRFTMNSLPLPGSLSRVMVPPIRSTMFLVMERPRPVPWMPLTVELSSRVNSSKMCFWNSLLMPMPLSLMRNS